MIYYASRTGTRRNLAAMRAAGFRILISRTGEWRTGGFAYALDNGAWSDFQAGKPFDEDAFERLIVQLGAGADWVVLPDIVAGGLNFLALSKRWLNRTLSICPLVLIALQDGMEESDIAPLVGPNVGIFLGGSTAWKLATMHRWGRFAAARGIYYHVASVDRHLSSIDGAQSTVATGRAALSADVARLLDGTLAAALSYCYAATRLRRGRPNTCSINSSPITWARRGGTALPICVY